MFKITNERKVYTEQFFFICLAFIPFFDSGKIQFRPFSGGILTDISILHKLNGK